MTYLFNLYYLIDTDESMSQKSILLRSPFITLLHMITWNQYGCCPTLTDMDTFGDFFKVYKTEVSKKMYRFMFNVHIRLNIICSIVI